VNFDAVDQILIRFAVCAGLIFLRIESNGRLLQAWY
jgi:hypothetical protein